MSTVKSDLVFCVFLSSCIFGIIAKMLSKKGIFVEATFFFLTFSAWKAEGCRGGIQESNDGVAWLRLFRRVLFVPSGGLPPDAVAEEGSRGKEVGVDHRTPDVPEYFDLPVGRRYSVV